MSARTTHSSISCRACSWAMPRSAWPSTSGISSAGTFMVALLRRWLGETASVQPQAGRPSHVAVVSSTHWLPAYPVPQTSSLVSQAARALAPLASAGGASFLGLQVG